MWRWEPRGGTWAKAPYQACGTYAKLNDPSTWLSFDGLIQASADSKFDGIGFVLTADDPFAMVDLDHCIDPATNQILPWAYEIVAQLRSYTEITPSGEGLRVIVRATLPEGGRRRSLSSGGSVEMYDRARYMTVTGNHLSGTPETIEARDTEIANLHQQLFGNNRDASSTSICLDTASAEFEDREVLGKARSAKNRDKFRALFDGGDTTGYPSPSEADLALCALLAFWARGDARQVDRLFRCSALYRPEKWDVRHCADGKTYGQATVEKAIAGLAEVLGNRKALRRSEAPVRIDSINELHAYDRARKSGISGGTKWRPGTEGAYPNGRRWRADENGDPKPLPDDD